MVLKHHESLDKVFPRFPIHGRLADREELWTEGHMKANALMALICSLDFMKEKELDLEEYYNYLGKKAAPTWEKNVFLTKAAKKTGALGFTRTLIMMFEGMLCNFDEGLDYEINGKEHSASLKMKCFGAEVLKRFAEIKPNISVEELCPMCTTIIKPVAEKLGMQIDIKPGIECSWSIRE